MKPNQLVYLKINELLRTIDLTELTGDLLVTARKLGKLDTTQRPSECDQLARQIVYLALTRLVKQFQPATDGNKKKIRSLIAQHRKPLNKKFYATN